MIRKATLLLGWMALASTLSAQEESFPPGWKLRLDHANAKARDFKFVTMSPGWHITTGPAGIVYRPDLVGRGNYRIESTIFLFDPGRRHREAYGIIFGGANLQSPNQRYSYFLIRDTGEFLIKRREGSSTSTVKGWTPTDAIKRFPGDNQQARNTLAIEFGDDSVSFFINGSSVATIPRSNLDTEGIVGLRVNHSLNLHLTSLEIK